MPTSATGQTGERSTELEALTREGEEELAGELERRRDQALAAILEALDHIEAADLAFERADALLEGFEARHITCSSAHIKYHLAPLFKNLASRNRLRSLRQHARQHVDAVAWNAALERSALGCLLHQDGKAQYRELVFTNLANRSAAERHARTRPVPAFSRSNLRATLEHQAGAAERTWLEGLAATFRQFKQRYKSHDGFTVGTRVILEGALSYYGPMITAQARDALTDLERVFRVLDGHAPSSAFRCEILQAIEDAPLFGQDHHGEYFRCRFFLNRNLHVYFKRLDLLERVNQHLARAHERAIGWRASKAP